MHVEMGNLNVDGILANRRPSSINVGYSALKAFCHDKNLVSRRKGMFSLHGVAKYEESRATEVPSSLFSFCNNSSLLSEIYGALTLFVISFCPRVVVMPCTYMAAL